MSNEFPSNERLGHMERPPLLPALLAGLGAALVGGAVWTGIMALTGYEVGYAAWALGGLVGLAMKYATPRRGPVPAASAARMALVGLIFARVLIGEFVLATSGVDEILGDEQLLQQAAVVDLQLYGGFPEDVQTEYDAIAEGDTISDALWDRMVSAGSDHLAALPDEDRVVLAEQLSGLTMQQLGPVGRVAAQLSAFDLLWAFLALSTAWGMMKKEDVASDGAIGTGGANPPAI